MIPEQTNSEQITQNSQSNFAASFAFLPPVKRRALTSIYAFCRITDDIVDLAQDESGARATLASWRAMCAAAFENGGAQDKAAHPVLLELVSVARAFEFPQTYAQELIDGMEMDLTQKTYATFEDLYAYCYRAASVVGLMCMHVFGFTDRARAMQYAEYLGIAFQLTNILRDVRGDLERGRVYIPQRDLEQFGLSAQELLGSLKTPLSGQQNARVRELMLFECARAREYYSMARERLNVQDRKSWIAAEIMESVYRAILNQIEREPLAPLHGKVKIPKWKKIGLIAKACVLNRLNL